MSKKINKVTDGNEGTNNEAPEMKEEKTFKQVVKEHYEALKANKAMQVVGKIAKIAIPALIGFKIGANKDAIANFFAPEVVDEVVETIANPVE